jgi:hypothetical protein
MTVLLIPSEYPCSLAKWQLDINHKLWVQCDGNFAGTTSRNRKTFALVRIDPETHTVEQIFRWDATTDYGGDLQINPALDSLYIVKGDLYKTAVNTRRLPEMPSYCRRVNVSVFQYGCRSR